MTAHRVRTLALVVVAGALLAVWAFPVLWALLLGAIMSVMVSAWLLRDLRDKFALRVQQRAERSVAAHRDRDGSGQTSGEE